MSAADFMCRTCGKTSEQNDGTDLFPMFTSTEYNNELKMVLSEFEKWNLNISQDDGLPQKICLTCFDSFCQIHNFRIMCEEAQTNFGELCIGLDIIIKSEPEYDFLDGDFPEDFECEQTVTIQEHYQFPGGGRSKGLDPLTSEQTENIGEERDCEMVLNENFEETDAIGNEENYQCEFCMNIVSFEDPDLLNDHYNLMHSSDFPYLCPKCDKCYNTKAKRNKHAKTHFRITIKCNICGKDVKGGEPMLVQHNELHHVERDRECTVCGKKFVKATLKTFHYHMSYHEDAKLHKCKYCPMKFSKINSLVVHERSHTGDGLFNCPDCSKSFKNAVALKNHCKQHGGQEFQCPTCQKIFNTKVKLTNHMETHLSTKKRVHCDICEKNFRTIINLRVHKYQKHGIAPPSAVKHILKKREAMKIKPYKCGKCPETFLLHTQLVKHLKVHDENRPFRCSTCFRAFKRDAHLRLHVNSVHLNKKPFKCTICGWAFIQKRNLNEHYISKHTQTRDFKCEICGKGFAIAKTLKTHMVIHSDEKPFACTICNKQFKQQNVLREHMGSHMRKNEMIIEEGVITDIII